MFFHSPLKVRLMKSVAEGTQSHQGHTKLFSLCHTLASRLALRLTCFFPPVLDLFLPSLSSFCLSPSLSLCLFSCPLSCSATAISSDGWEESELVRVRTSQTGGGGEQGIFNTHRLYSMSAMFPRWCRAFLYAFSASAILPWFFSTFPKFPQATEDMSVKSCTFRVKKHNAGIHLKIEIAVNLPKCQKHLITNNYENHVQLYCLC